MWCRDVMTSCHDVNKLDSPISACRWARKMFFLFPWFFRSLISNMSLCFSFLWCRDVMTSCHDITKLDSPISACRWARKMFLFLFPWFCRSMSSKISMIFYSYDVMTSWRHDIMPWRHKNCLTYLRLWNHWKDDRVQDSMVFLAAYSRNVSVHVFLGWYHVMTSRQYLASLYNIY